MIDKIKAGIAAKLDAAFDGVPVSSEEIKQGLDGPCFFIKVLVEDETQLLGRRYKRNHSLDVHYFPPQGESENLSIDSVSSQLFELLEYISLDGHPTKGTGMTTERVDGVLHFMVQYNFTVVREVTPEDSMETLTLELNV